MNFQRLSLACFVFLCAVEILTITSLCDGKLIYSLDDPYIHLALAENIARGVYGINLTEFASPSSSILYPFLLVPLVDAGFGEWSPLLLILPAQAATVWLLSGVVGRAILSDGSDSGPLPILSAAICALVLPFSVNALGLVMTGMEHSIHCLAALLVMIGLHRMVEANRLPRLLIPAIIVGALIRFEGLALSLFAIAAMATCGRRKAALATIFAIALSLLAYIFLMRSLGLPMMPSSVLTKSSASAAALDSNFGTLVGALLNQVFGSLQNRWGTMFALAIVACLLAAFRPGRSKADRVVVLVGCSALIAHIVAGAYGWFGRYEVYAVVFMLSMLAVAFGPVMRQSAPAAARWTAAAILSLVAVPYFAIAAQTPLASRNIYQQQYQMHRFATTYFARPVAINDLGWVSYRNDQYVLDLWGLGSESARRMAQTGRTAAAIDALTANHHVAFAMIYDAWFPDLPRNWCRIAELRTSQVTTASDRVAFYLVDGRQREAMGLALEKFAGDLPRGASLTINGCPPTTVAHG